jgi:hypothetical protein
MTCPSKAEFSASKLGMRPGMCPFCARVRLVLVALAIFGAAFGGAEKAQAQASSGPQTPSKTPNVIRIPVTPVPEKAPPIAPDEIIRRFSAQEDALAQTVQGYTYRKVVRVQEFGADGKPTGQSEITSTPSIDADGKRYQKISGGEQDSTLRVLSLERDALQALSSIPSFPLGTAQISKYEISYEGTQPLDELMTYVFRVRPAQVDRTHAYFDGLIWVDNHDLAIVKTYGKWMTETGPMSLPMLPFTMYETYRQPVENKYWMPAYSSSDATVPMKNGELTVRLVIRWDQYAPVSADKPAVPTPAAAPRSEQAAPSTSSR